MCIRDRPSRIENAVPSELFGITSPRILRQEAELTAYRALAFGRLQLTRKATRQRRLAGAVAADQADLVARVYPKADLAHEAPRANIDREVLDDNHSSYFP